MFFGGVLNFGGLEVVGWGRKSYLAPAQTCFSSRDFSWSYKHDTFWHVVSTGYFYVLFLWAIAASDICPLEIYKNVGLSLSTISFTVNSQADNLKYIHLSQILYTVWDQVFLLKYTLRFFTFKLDLIVKHRSYFF